MLEYLTLRTILPDTCHIPSYAGAGSIGLDFYAQEDTYIGPGSTVLVDTGFSVDFPDGFYGLLIARSSLHKRGLVLANGVGLIDTSYRGPEDNIKAALRNITDAGVTLKAGERFVQLVLQPAIVPAQLNVDFYDTVEEIEGENRGGFGSTGT
jgi:dUTP pyrophosphatase